MWKFKNKLAKTSLIFVLLIFVSVFVNAITKTNQPILQEAYRREFKGEGTVIAIIDSGADTHHKDFVISDERYVKLKESDVKALIAKEGLEGKYVSPKIPYVRDYYGKDNDIFSKDEHGMHVAGIAAANGEVKGVAPEAQLLLMKVFPDEGLNEDLKSETYYVQAIRDAIKLGADVINLSLGTGAGTEKFVGQEVKAAMKEAEQAGVVVNVAAGNHGYFGFNEVYPKAENPDYGVIAMPGILKDVVSVASLEGERISHTKILANGAYYPYQIAYSDALSYYDPMPYGEKVELVDVGFGTDLDYQDLNVSGKIALAMRGKKSFRELQKLARQHEARGLIIYNNEENEDELFELDGSEFSLPVAIMKHKDGLALAKSQYIHILRDQMDSYNENAGKVSRFSAWGTTNEGVLKPDILAPGGSILSLNNHGEYKRMSGTSMATPYISGVSAIIKQRLNETYPQKKEGLDLTRLMKRILLSSAKPVFEKDRLVSPRKQGSGLVDIKGVVSAQAIAYLDEDSVNLNLGNVENTIRLQVNLENISNKTLHLSGTYQLLVDDVKDGRFTLLSNLVKSGEVEKIELPPFAKKTMTYELDISDVDFRQFMKNGHFIDGFLQFNYGANMPGLNLAFTSFKGEFEKLPMLEKPIYERQEDWPTYYSKISKENEFTHLASSMKINDEDVAVVLGETLDSKPGHRKFDGKHLALSPNDDHHLDNMDFVFTILRSFEKITINIVNEKGQVVAKHTAMDRIDHLKSYYGGDFRNNKAVNLWKFVPKTDMENGKYKAEVIVERYNGRDELTYDFYIDTKPPKLDRYALKNQLLSLECSDELSGVKTIVLEKNGKEIKKNAQGLYPIKQDHLQGIAVLVVDWAGNVFSTKLK